MKYIYRIATIVLAASALLLSSCTKEKAVGVAEGELVEYTLQAEVIGTGVGLDIDTKVALNADGITPNWEEDDQILVLDADKKPLGEDGIFTLSSGAGTASGKFTGLAYVGQAAAYAIYPASAATVSGSSAVTAGTLSAPTGNDAGTIRGAVMLGTSIDGTTMAFTNACAVLTFNTGDYGKSGGDPAIIKVKVSASYGSTAAPLAGAFTIDWANLSIAPAGSGTVNKLTVDLPIALQANDKDVFIPIFPLPMQSSTAPSMMYMFTNMNDWSAEIAHDFSSAIAANTLKNLGSAQGMEFVIPPYVEITMKVDDVTKTYKWAKCNLGAEKETDYGTYFMWGATEPAYSSLSGTSFTFYSSKPSSYINSTWNASKGFNWENAQYTDGIYVDKTSLNVFTKYTKNDKKYAKSGTADGKDSLDLSDDAANVVWGGNWRIPTSKEFKALFVACGGSYLDSTPIEINTSSPSKGIYWLSSSQSYIPDYSGVAGCLCVDDSGNRLFFPANGFGGGTNLQKAGEVGRYWGSTLATLPYDANYCEISSTKVFGGGTLRRYYGYTIRPISE